jgi:hypothetical protein
MRIESNHTSMPWRPTSIVWPEVSSGTCPVPDTLFSYTKVKVQRVGDAAVEYWQGFREFGKIVYRRGTIEMEFPAEWLGWGRWRGHWLWVLLPPNVPPDADAGLDVNFLASQIHLALCLMKIRNVVTVETRSVPAMTEEREATLMKFTEWMSHRGWYIVMTRLSRLGRKLQIKRRGFSLLRPKASVQEIIARGRWTAKAFEALRQYESKDVALYIGEGAGHSDFLVSIDW